MSEYMKPLSGRDIMFVSNIDNTCATLNLKIAQMMADENVEYAMECTKKTENDIKVPHLC